MPLKGEMALAAVDYCRRGWSVIPCCWPGHSRIYRAPHSCSIYRQGKAPLIPWKKAQHMRADETLISNWWFLWPLANVGVVMGQVSGMIGWDIDTTEGQDAFQELIGKEVPWTMAFFTGGGGVRYLYRWPGEAPPPPAHFKTRNKALSFLGEGSYSIFPPSLHRSGEHYQWVPYGGPGEIELAEATPAMVEALLAHKGENRKPVGGRVVDDRVPPPYEQEALFARARGWARKHDPAVQGQGGRVVAFKLACALVHGFGLDTTEALVVMLKEWNHRCSPPWEQGELWERVASAAKNGSFPKIEARPLTERR